MTTTFTDKSKTLTFTIVVVGVEYVLKGFPPTPKDPLDILEGP